MSKYMLDRDTYYPLKDFHPLWRTHRLMAKWSGEKRPPKKGQWYLSGAVIEAYQAKRDLDAPYPIAEIYSTREVKSYVGVKLQDC